jgi:hypothetical protein
MPRLGFAAAAMLAMAAIASVGVVAVVAARVDDPVRPSTAPRPAQVAHQPEPAAKANNQPGTITIEARDLVTDAPIAAIRLEFSTGGGSKRILAATDSTGTAGFSYAADIRYFLVRASREGLVPEAISWPYESSSPAPPDRVLFQMDKATAISGRVIDHDGQPVPGATVVVGSKAYPTSRQRVALPGSEGRRERPVRLERSPT